MEKNLLSRPESTSHTTSHTTSYTLLISTCQPLKGVSEIRRLEDHRSLQVVQEPRDDMAFSTRSPNGI